MRNNVCPTNDRPSPNISITAIRESINSRLSDLTIRRILGWLQIIPFAFGLYSNFYFLGGSKVRDQRSLAQWDQRSIQGGRSVRRSNSHRRDSSVPSILPCSDHHWILLYSNLYGSESLPLLIPSNDFSLQVDRWAEQRALEEEKKTKKITQKSQ